MRHRTLALAAAGLATILGTSSPARAQKGPAALPGGFVALFNGKGLDGWSGAVENYEVVGGAIRCRPSKSGMVYFNREFSDFAARVEFRLPPDCNNGLAIRYPGQGDTTYAGDVRASGA